MPGDLTESPPPAMSSEEVLAKARAENFSVASRLLPRRARGYLYAIYGYARAVDDLGDLARGDRLAQLDWAEAEIRRAVAGDAAHPVFAAAGEFARATSTPVDVFVDLIEANRMDQTVHRYDTFGDLVGYCTLSANPVGRMVLSAFGVEDGTAAARSDDVCTALQVIEHLQDVAEDLRQDRIYLPLEDLDRFGVREEDLFAPSASPALRAVVALEAERAHALLERGRPLCHQLRGAARLAVSGYVGGGLAQIHALATARFDVLAAPVKASSRAVAMASARVLARSVRR